jgi:GTP cyclohydrolase-4
LSQFKRDLQNEEIEFGKIALDKVGITNVLKKIEIIRNNFKIYINGSISAYIFLPETQRGIHMSRSAESIENVINHAAFQPVQTIEEFCSRICSALIKQHSYTNRSEVELVGTLILSSKPTERMKFNKLMRYTRKSFFMLIKKGNRSMMCLWGYGLRE